MAAAGRLLRLKMKNLLFASLLVLLVTGQREKILLSVPLATLPATPNMFLLLFQVGAGDAKHRWW